MSLPRVSPSQALGNGEMDAWMRGNLPASRHDINKVASHVHLLLLLLACNLRKLSG